MNLPKRVGVLGASSPVGQQILAQLNSASIQTIALSRTHQSSVEGNVQWVKITDFPDQQSLAEHLGPISHWIVITHIWLVESYTTLFERCEVERLVCISSTSRFTKTTSSDSYEEELVQKLINGEHQVEKWSETHNVRWTTLRPTLIYGRGNDRNLSEIVKIIKKTGAFPLFGKGNGLRQPIYVDDVAKACIQALGSINAHNKAYNISGAEVLSYREMVGRVFEALKKKERFITIPLPIFKIALLFLKLIPKYRKWNGQMVQRMNSDMIFDHQEAIIDFDFKPQKFLLNNTDISA